MNTFEETFDDFQEKMIEGFKAPFPGEPDPNLLSSPDPEIPSLEENSDVQINNLPNRPTSLQIDNKPVLETPPKTNKQSRRYHELYRKANLAEQEKNQLAAKLEEAYGLLEAERKKAKEQEDKSYTYFEQLQNAQQERQIEKAKQAKVTGDIEAETEANLELMKIQANKSTFDLYKYQKEREENRYRENFNRNDDIVEYPVDSVNESYNEYEEEGEYQDELRDYLHNVWYPKNRWANPQDPLYNPSLKAEAELFIDHRNKERAILGQEATLQEQLEEVSNAVRAVYLGNTPQSNYSSTQRSSHPMPISSQRPPESRVAAPSGRSTMADLYVNNSPNRGDKMALHEDQLEGLSALKRMYPHRSMEELRQTFVDSVNKYKNTNEKFVKFGV